MLDPATGEYRVIAPGQTFKSVTEKIARIVLTPHTPLGWFALFSVAGAVATVLLVAVTWLFLKGVGHLGHHAAGGLGLRDYQLCVVDRHRPRRHADLGDSAAVQAGLAQLDQPLCRGDDDLRRRLRRHVPADPRGPPVAGVLAVPVSQHHGRCGRSSARRCCGTCSRFRLTRRSRWSSGTSAWFPTSARCATAPRSKLAQYIYGLLSLGWRGSVRHWMRYETASLLLAGLATPLVLSVHTVISFDFAVAVLPGWHTTIFPPYFVAGAIYSGFAMVLTLAIPLRKFYHLEGLVTERHIDNMGKVMLATGFIVAYGYGMEVVHGLVLGLALGMRSCSGIACSGRWAGPTGC